MMVIGIIGTKGSGKDTVAEYIAKKYHVGHHSHSEIYREILEVLHVPTSRMNLIKLSELRNTFGENVLIHALNKKLIKENRELQVVTGIRYENELQNIRSYENNFVLYIDAPIEQRYERHIKRKQYVKDEDVSFSDFAKIEDMETERSITGLGARADYKIDNLGDLQELFAKVDSVIEPVMRGVKQ